MCVSAGLAQFTGTILYLGRRNHPEYGQVFVLGYENRATNLSEGPNAMFLHFPALGMTQKNFLGTSKCSSILTDMRETVIRSSLRSYEMAWMGSHAEMVEVFDRGIYTVVLASNARCIPDALNQVPVRKRIAINRPLFDFYAEHFPGYPVALCCFDNTEARESEPLLLWYKPMNPDRFVLPGLDGHTGGVPALHEQVEVDHWIIVSSDDMPDEIGSEVHYSNGSMPWKIRSFLPSRVLGKYFRGTMRNGDFTLLHDDVVRGDLSRIQRVLQ